MPLSASDSGGSDLCSSVDVPATKPQKGTGVFLPRSAAGSRALSRPQAAQNGTQQQQQGLGRSYSGNSVPLISPGASNIINCGNCGSGSFSSSIPVPMPSTTGATRPLAIAGSSSTTSSSRRYLQDYPYNHHYDQQQLQQQRRTAPLPHPIAAQYAVAAAAALTSTYEDEHEDVLYLGGNGVWLTDPADGALGVGLEACSDELLFGPGSLPGGYSLNGNSPISDSLTAAAELNSSWAQLQGGSYGNGSVSGFLGGSVGAAGSPWVHSKALEQQQQVQPAQGLAGLPSSSSGSFNGRMNSSSIMRRGQWTASALLPPAPPPPPAREFSRGASQVLVRQQSTSLTGYGYVQQPDTAPDQILGSSYQQQQMQQQLQQMQPAGSVACSPGADFNAEMELAGCYSPRAACTTSGLVANNSSSMQCGLGMTGQQQQHAVRLQGRLGSSDAPLRSLSWPANEQQLHNQISSSSSTVALQPLLSSSSNSCELQAVHAINAQLTQLLKLKEEVLAAKAAAATAAAPPPLPATVPMPAPTAVYSPASASGLLTGLGRTHSISEHLQPDQQQQQLLFGLELQPQPQPQLLGTSLGSASVVTPSSYHLALGMQAGTANQLPASTLDVPVRSRCSSTGSSIRIDQRHVVGSWAGDGRTNGQLSALEQARQKHAVRAVTEQKLQQLAAVQRMQLDLQQELLQMLQ